MFDDEAGKCIACAVPGCKSCTKDYTVCDSCEWAHDWTEVDGRAVLPPNGVMSDKGCCLSHECTAVGCTTCNEHPERCDACEEGYTMSPHTRMCLPCMSSTCKTCSNDAAKCDSCPDGFKLNWFHGTCEPCKQKNCKSCNVDVMKCDACPHGFDGDAELGTCWATSPTPVQGQCEALPAPYDNYALGSCGQKVHWFGCDVANSGAFQCYEAVMAEEKCIKDFFSYSRRGDKGCSCKISSELAPEVNTDVFSDCYQIGRFAE